MAADRKLAFGLRDLPEDLTCAWGARWIWPNDLVWNRQDTFPHAPADQSDVKALHDWLNSGPLAAAREEAAELARTSELSPADNRTLTLFEDHAGIVQANPQGSHGYLYVAAWLKS